MDFCRTGLIPAWTLRRENRSNFTSITTPRYNFQTQEKISLKPHQGCNQRSRQNIETGEGEVEGYCTVQRAWRLRVDGVPMLLGFWWMLVSVIWSILIVMCNYHGPDIVIIMTFSWSWNLSWSLVMCVIIMAMTLSWIMSLSWLDSVMTMCHHVSHYIIIHGHLKLHR